MTAYCIKTTRFKNKVVGVGDVIKYIHSDNKMIKIYINDKYLTSITLKQFYKSFRDENEIKQDNSE